MLKFIVLIHIFIFFITNAYAYMDPVSIGILTQILFAILSGILIFFTKLRNLFSLLFVNYKYSNILLYFVALLPFWIFLENLDIKIKIISFIFFFVIPFSLILIVIKVFKLTIKNKIFIFINSLITVYGLDQSFKLASLVNLLGIMDDVIRYSSYFILFIFLIFVFYYLYLKNYKIINFLILVIFISSIINLINNNNISSFVKYENIENNVLRINDETNIIQSKPTIVIILDELNGYAALDDKIESTKQTKESIDALFENYQFTHYTNSYSIYPSTYDTIPSLLNFYYKYDYKKLDLMRENHINKFGFFGNVKENKLFDLYNPNEIYVRQSLTLNLCNNDNFRVCKTVNPFSKNNIYMDNFELNNFDKFFSMYNYQTSIFSTLLTRFLRYLDLITILEPRIIGKVTIEQILEDLFIQSKTKKYSLIFAHIMAPHKPFAWDKKTCTYKYYQNQNFLSEQKVQEFHNNEIICLNKFLTRFLDNLNKSDLLNYYRIVLTSDHGARNLDYNNKDDWYSTMYAERVPKNYYQKIDEKISTQYLFKKFFNNENEKKPINKIYNIKKSIYELN